MHHVHHLTLTVAPDPLVLDRIVGVCRHRRCPIGSLQFLAADGHRPGEVTLTVHATAQRARLLLERLRALTDVLEVHTRPAAVAHHGRSVERVSRSAA